MYYAPRRAEERRLEAAPPRATSVDTAARVIRLERVAHAEQGTRRSW